ncbi:MLP-like protein 43 [Cucurbita pepo subsp. pepo]|uniref:MLP-like protein 43 n=1 Tax=Cucurbita pepo subsp. pepo TaxID=3664 RepID=UPI000C9D2C25|nr:MLP-like protein 43 [Cucurbita pepo subsp. pepo]
MGLFEKVETDVEIRASSLKCKEIIHERPHHISDVSTDIIHGINLHEGEWGKVDSILYWKYLHEGKACVSKRVIEAVDEENNSLTWKEIEGDLSKHYKNFRIKVQCIPKDKGSVIHITLEYEKLHEQIPDSHTFLQLCVDTAKDIDAHLMGYDNEGSCIAAKA